MRVDGRVHDEDDHQDQQNQNRNANGNSSGGGSGRNPANTVLRFRDVKRGQVYDVLDSSGRWCEGRVMKLSPENENVFVAYLYWDSRFDEWVNNVEERLAPLHTHTYIEGGVLKVGQRIEVLDDTQKWLESFVIEESEDSVKIHYKGYHAKFDEVILRSDASKRIRPYGRHKTLPRREQPGPRQFRLPKTAVPGSAGDRNREGKHASRIKAPSVGVGDDVVTYNHHDPQQSLNSAPYRQSGNQHDDYHSNSVDRDEEVERTRRIGNMSEQYNRYSAALAKQGLTVVPVLGDGNCLFRAVAHQVYGDEAYHDVVRAKCLDYMEVESDFFSQFVEGGKDMFPLYLQAKRTDACWGDDPEIEALCELYDRRAEIWAFDATAGARKLRTFHETGGPGAAGGASVVNGCSSSSGSNGVVGFAYSDGRPLTSPPRSASGQRSAQSPRLEEAPVIRLSYYGGGHYDSIVTPHHRDTTLKRPPGELEDRHIARTVLRRQQRATGPGASTHRHALDTDVDADVDTALLSQAQRASDAEATEREALDMALQESRRAYLNSDYEDLETCLRMSLQQYALESGQAGIAAYIPLLKESAGAERSHSKDITDTNGTTTAPPAGEKGSATENGKGDRKQVNWLDEQQQLEDGLLKSVQEQSERDYYETAVLSSLQADGKVDDTDLTEQQLLDLVAKQSAHEEEARERAALEAALRESAAMAGSSGGMMMSQPKADTADRDADVTPAKHSNRDAVGGQARDPRDVIHLSDLKENDALAQALQQSRREAEAKGYADYSELGFQNEDEMLNFALQASLQGYTSPDYADYKHAMDGDQQGKIRGSSASTSAGLSAGAGAGASACGNAGASSWANTQASSSSNGPSNGAGNGYTVNLGPAYGSGSGSAGASAGASGNGIGGAAGYAEEDYMDEDLMRAIAESLKK